MRYRVIERMDGLYELQLKWLFGWKNAHVGPYKDLNEAIAVCRMCQRLDRSSGSIKRRVVWP